MTITISASGIALDGPLVAGEKVAVSVSGLALVAEDKPTLALLARFPDALLASVELAESADAPGTWTGELDTATKQTALFFATARADERRDAALELVSGRASLARLTVPMANSALCPKPDGSPFASPVYVPVPGPPGTGGDPYDQAPEMDGEASAGAADEYARGDHRHPTDTTRQAVIEDLAAIRSGAAAGATAVQPSALGTAASKDVPTTGDASSAQVVMGNDTRLTNARTPTAHASTAQTFGVGDETQFGHIKLSDDPSASTLNTDQGTAATPYAVSVVGALASEAASAVASLESRFEDLATVATTGDYGDLLNKPTIPAAQVNADWNASSGVAQILNKPTIPDVSGKASSASIAPAFSTSSTYAVGDYVTYEGLLYKCTTAVSTAGDWDATKWQSVSIYTNLPYDAELEYITLGDAYIDTGFSCKSASTSTIGYSATFKLNEAIPGTTITYLTGQAGCSYISRKASSDNICVGYKSTSTVCADQTTAMSGFNTYELIGNEAYFNGALKGTSSGNQNSYDYTFLIGRARNTSGTIQVGYSISYSAFKLTSAGTTVRDFIPVRKGSVAYFYDKVSGTLFGVASGSPAAGLGPDKAATLPLMDGTASHGTSEEMSPIDHVHPTDTTRAPLASPAFTGTPTAPTAASGTNTTQVATTAFVQGELRYAFASQTPTVSGTSATVACEDRAINDFTVATGITSLTITPPAAVTGRARDFFCRVTLTDSSLPTVTLSGGTIDIGATEVAGMTHGVNLLMFTEIASGHWLASRRSAS